VGERRQGGRLGRLAINSDAHTAIRNLQRCAQTIRARDTGSPVAQRAGRSETRLTEHEQQGQSWAPTRHEPGPVFMYLTGPHELR
jgi:hypothetical protein